MIKQELTTGDVVKKDDIKNRIWVRPEQDDILRADKQVICGKTFLKVFYDTETCWLVALSNLENGKVLVQPAESQISLQGFTRADIAEQLGIALVPHPANGSIDPMERDLINSYCSNGVQYIDFPQE